jgi:hypothetical protein
MHIPCDPSWHLVGEICSGLLVVEHLLGKTRFRSIIGLVASLFILAGLAMVSALFLKGDDNGKAR